MVTIMQILKIVLTILALRQYFNQMKKDNTDIGYYWLIVALYWFVNFMQGLSH